MKNKKPSFFLTFKILGSCTLIGIIIGFVLLIGGFRNIHNNNFIIGAFVLSISFFLTFVFFMIGFSPEINKSIIRSRKFIQEENKNDLQSIISTNAEISQEAVKTVSKAVKDGMSNKKFCKECGKEIDKDSKFCSFCGKEQ